MNPTRARAGFHATAQHGARAFPGDRLAEAFGDGGRGVDRRDVGVGVRGLGQVHLRFGGVFDGLGACCT
jgi:hypothetical protein